MKARDRILRAFLFFVILVHVFNHLKNKLIIEKAIIFACFGVFIAIFVYGWPVWNDTRSIASKMPWLENDSAIGIVLAGLMSPDVNDTDTISMSRKLAASPLRDKYRQEGAAFVLPAKEEDGVAYKIGAPDGENFSPAVTIERWDGDVRMKIMPRLSYKNVEGEKIIDTATSSDAEQGVLTQISNDSATTTVDPALDSGADESSSTTTDPGTDEEAGTSSTTDSGIDSADVSTSSTDSGTNDETSGSTDTGDETAPEEVPASEDASLALYGMAHIAAFTDSFTAPLAGLDIRSSGALFIDKDETGEDKVIKFETSDRQYIFYDKTVTIPNDKYSNGMISEVDGYEFEFSLKEKPDTNVFDFDIETENLDFFYQPPLNVEMSDPECTATDCREYHRPVNIVGSYAVYYKDGVRGDYSAAGGKNYMTGMAFTIYRPQAFDASGNSVWCDLNIDEASGIMTITVPQYFLDQAKYPVIVDPTFGNTTAGTSYTSSINNQMVGSVFSSGAAGTVVTTTAYMYPDAGYYAAFGIYNSSYQWVANTASTSVGTTQAWYAYKLVTSTVISNSTYWLLKNDNDSSNYFYYTTGATNQSLQVAQTFGTWPSSFGSPTLGNLQYSIYATYNEITASTTVGATGTQTTTLYTPSTFQYVGGAFTIVSNSGSRNVTGITITESGTVDAQNNLSNVRLYYDLDTSAPYDCASESFSGSESQFGSTDADGFSGTNGTSAFSGTVAISTTQTMCVYVVLDISSNAGIGDTLEIGINNASTDVTTSAGTISPSGSVAISGTTTLYPNNLPTFVNAGTCAGGTGTITPGMPGSVLTGDILLLFTETYDAPAVTLSGGTETWRAVSSSPVGIINYTRLSAFWARASQNSPTSPTTNDTGNHQSGCIIAIRNAVSTGTPWDTVSTGTENTSDTSGSITGTSTLGTNRMIVAAMATDLPDASGSSNFSSWANSDLVNVTERVDYTDGSGNGGGIGVATGAKSTAGSYGATTVTLANAARKAFMTLAIKGNTSSASVADVTVGTTGSQESVLVIPSTNNYVGGAFTLTMSTTSYRTVSGISINEAGTVDAQNNLKNIKLYYDLDTSTPYDCTSESFGGSESQFGSTDADGFSGTNGTSTFSGSVQVSSTRAMCVYVVLDVSSGASNGDTLDLQITNPDIGVTLSSGTVGPSSTVAISGSTTLSPPGISGSLGKTSDGWSGAIPITLRLWGLSSTTYPYARASTTNPAGVTSYTNLTWDSATSAYTGVIYPGSNYCNGCADPDTGTFNVTAQLSSSSNFSGIDYSSSAGTFMTFVTRRWNAVSTASMGNGTEFNPTWSTDHWAYSVDDFSVNAAATYSNVAVAIPFLPTSSAVSNIAVTVGGTSVSQGSATSTSNAWWWNSALHTLFVQIASLGTTYQTIHFSFDTDTDLLATRFDRLYTANIGERLFYNGILLGNQFINTPVFGGGYEGSGEQVEMSARNSSNDDVNLDSMERAAVHVGDTIRSDSSAYFSSDIKWKQDEWVSMIASQDNNSIAMTVHSDNTASTGWAQQLNNGISATRVQTFYASKRYIKNEYVFTNGGASSYKYPFVWMREQLLGTDQSTNDVGYFAGDSGARTTEIGLPFTAFSKKWFTTFDTGVYAAMGVIFKYDDPANMGYLLQHAVLTNATPWAEWPIVTTSYGNTLASDIAFTRTWSSIAVGSSATFTFWQWGYSTTSWAAVSSSINADYNEVNVVIPVVSVTVSDGVVTYGTMAAGSSKGTIDLGDAQGIANSGNVNEDFFIKGQDGTGGGCTWTLGSSAGTDQYVHSYCNATDLTCTSPPTNYTAASTTYQTLDTSVPSSSTTSLQLRLTAPNISSCFGEQDVDMTVMATQS